MNWIGNFLAKCFSTDGAISFGRVGTFFLMVFCVGWDTSTLTFILTHQSVLHSQISDLWVPVATLLGQVTFFSAPYAITKGKDALNGTPGTGQ